MRAPLTLILLGCLAACSRQSPEAPSAPATARPSPIASAAPSAAPTSAGVARAVDESNSDYELEYSYPAAAAAIPALKAELEADLRKQRTELVATAKEQRALSKENGFDYNPVSAGVAWRVVTDLPGWLSLSANLDSFEGGAHPNHGYDALLWDRHANVRRKAVDLFTSKAAFTQAIHRDFCAALDKQRAERRKDEPIDADGIDEFTKCIDPTQSTVILGSSNHATFDRIGVLIAPYAAGPYAEGDYEVTLPVTAAVLAAVKPEYRASFSVKR